MELQSWEDMKPVYWVECDFCGRKTERYITDEGARFKWNRLMERVKITS
jgi:hypothetical protein